MWVYIMSEKPSADNHYNYLWTVGFYDPSGEWHTDSDYNAQDDAANRVAFLNGSAVEVSRRPPPAGRKVVSVPSVASSSTSRPMTGSRSAPRAMPIVGSRWDGDADSEGQVFNLFRVTLHERCSHHPSAWRSCDLCQAARVEA